jgi:plastocyanin
MRVVTFLVLSLVCLSFAAQAEVPVYELVLKDQQFQPAELVIPANTKVKLLIKNMDTAAAEFESRELNREKIIPAGSQAAVFIGPLTAGTYPYFDEFHMGTTGKIIVK